MSRTPTKYYVVDVGEDGRLEYDEFTDKEALTAHLAKLEPSNPSPLVFASPPISFSISRDPVVTIGAKPERKPRAKKQKAAKHPTNGSTIASKGAPVGGQSIDNAQ